MPILKAEHSQDDSTLVFIDDNPTAGKETNGHRIISWAAFKASSHSRKAVCLGIADTRLRARLADKVLSANIPIIGTQAANAFVASEAVLGDGACLSPFTAIMTNVRIGKAFHANLYSYVEHDCKIGDFVTFGPGVKCNGNVLIGDFAYIGSGAVIRQGTEDKPLVIGEGAVVGMGAVVTRDVLPGTTVVGNPAKLLIVT
jgi:sugar O-acyltransferase (sialic acid O-acetyltransferase NeuD family)